MKNCTSITLFWLPASPGEITGLMEGKSVLQYELKRDAFFNVIQLSDLPLPVKESVVEELTGCRLSNQVITGIINGTLVYRLTFRSGVMIKHVLYQDDGQRYQTPVEN